MLFYGLFYALAMLRTGARRQMLFYVAMCGLCGALTVTSAKGVSIALTALVAGRSAWRPPPGAGPTRRAAYPQPSNRGRTTVP